MGTMSYTRIIGADRNRLVQGCGSLIGIATGLICDRNLNDAEIHFLSAWLESNTDISAAWPGDVLFDRVKRVLADGVISTEERQHLIVTLEELCGGGAETAMQPGAVNQLAFDDSAEVKFPGFNFCVTGDFVFGPRDRVTEAISGRGGQVQNGITKKLHYLVVGLQGSDEWKHGSYGTKIEKAMAYKRDGLRIFIVREDIWSAALKVA